MVFSLQKPNIQTTCFLVVWRLIATDNKTMNKRWKNAKEKITITMPAVAHYHDHSIKIQIHINFILSRYQHIRIVALICADGMLFNLT